MDFPIEFLNSGVHPWASTAVAAVIALIVATVGFRIARAGLWRITRSRAAARMVVDCAEEPARLLVTLLALQAVWHGASSALYLIGPIRHGTTVALIAAITWLAVRSVAAAGRIVALTYPSDVTDNLHARRILTQSRVLTRVLISLVVIFGVASALMTFPSVRQVGTGLLASAGLAGLVVGFAAKPVLGNLLAGLQIALTQPIRLDDVVIIEGEFGRVEEITGSYVVVSLWDERRMVVPLQWFIEHPFQNWTRSSSQITGAVVLWVDYGLPLEPLRRELRNICEDAADWDRRVSVLQVTDCNDKAMQLRILVSSASAPRNWDLRCLVRERLIAFIEREYPGHLPRLRAEISGTGPAQAPVGAS